VEAGKEYRLQIDYVQNTDVAVMKFDLGPRVTMTDDQLLQRVGDADVVVYVGGISPRLEGEEMKVSDPGFKGGDRTTIELPQSQRITIERLHAAGKKVIMVNCSGGAGRSNPRAVTATPSCRPGMAVRRADRPWPTCSSATTIPVASCRDLYRNDKQLPDSSTIAWRDAPTAICTTGRCMPSVMA
jgi:beta-glucosidase